MIKKIIKYILYLFVFCYLMIVFLPKINLYYLGLKKLESYNIMIMSDNIIENNLSIDLTNITILYKNIKVAKIDQASISSVFFMTKLNVSDIKTDEIMKNFLPQDIKEVYLSYSLINPLNIVVNVDFEKGNAFVNIDWVNNKIVINLDVPKSFINQHEELKNKFKKHGKYYTYELEY